MKQGISLIFILLAIYFWNNTPAPFESKDRAFYCDAQYVANTRFANQYVDTKVNSTIIFPKSDDGVIFSTGTLTFKGETFMVNRDDYYTTLPSEITGISKVTISSERIKSGDNTPNAVWNQAVLPAATGITYYAGVVRLNEHLILIRTLTKPLMVCISR
ncbi:hypothetical protein ACJ8I8_17880 [Serratia sp. CY54717]|uniref:hypothetical protein n=1 Tax=Serratia TaxID=613 RepID=UPI003A8A1EC8